MIAAAWALVVLAAPARAETPPTAGAPAAARAVELGAARDGVIEPLAPREPDLGAPPAPEAPVDARSPLDLGAPPRPPSRVRLASRWWFWASLGGAAVAVVLAGLYLGPHKPYEGNAMPGSVGVF